MKMLKRIVSAVLAAAVIGGMAFPVSAENIYFDGDAGFTYIAPEEEEPEEEPEADTSDWDWNWDWDWNYKEPEEFSVKLKPSFTAKAVNNGVEINCDYVYNADFIRIYKYDKTKKKYVKLADSYSTYYLDTDVASKTSYSYKIRVYQQNGSKTRGSKLSDAVKVTTPLMPGSLDVYVSLNKIKLSWDKNKLADGYEVYYNKVKLTKKDKKSFFSSYSSNGMAAYHEDNENYRKAVNGNFKKLKTTSSTSVSLKRDKNYKYYFKLRAYQVKNGKKVYSGFSDVTASTSSESLFNGAKGKARSSLRVISYRSDVKEWTMSISAADKKIMDNFSAKHFTKNMSPYEKAQYLAEYIHYSVDYAYSDADLKKISGLSCISAVFSKKTGQCYQYNGALAEFLAYMGYDVRLVCGYRGYSENDRWSHYWCEITLDGVKYVIDAGNKKDGLYNFVLPYECTDKYLR